MARHHSLDIGPDRIAVLTLDMADKGANVLCQELVEELLQTMKRLHAMKEISGLMIRSGKPKQFIAGADINEIESLTNCRKRL